MFSGWVLTVLVRGSLEGLFPSSQDGSIADRIAQQMNFSLGRFVGDSEKRSWKMSLPILFADLKDSGVGNVEVLLEYQLPFMSKRADVVLCGSNPKSKKPTVLVIELKQWTNAEPVVGTDDVFRVGGLGSALLLHPGEQVSAYCTHMQDMNRYFESEAALIKGAAYLHNADSKVVKDLFLKPQTDLSRLFTSDLRGEWLNFLKENISGDNASNVADGLIRGRLAPSKQLMETVAKEIKERKQYVLLDEQKVAYSLVMAAVEKARTSNKKTAVIVKGGPGSGKSVIALSLLGELSRLGYSAIHASGARAFRNSLRKVAGHRETRVKNMFQFFNSFMNTPANSIDVLLADEAHRIRETSNNRYTKREQRSTKHQVDELMEVARVPVFLLDQHQVVRPGEVGTAEYIEARAKEAGLDVEIVELEGQFRCGGSIAYEKWVLDLLQLSEIKADKWHGDENFAVESASSPEDLEARLARKNEEGFKGRMTAGFCWKWHEPEDSHELPLDVKIGNWHKPWNLKSDKGIGGFLSGELWAIDPKGFEQIGCVYTAQGFEYDWNGVIFGSDLVWRNDHWVGQKSETADPAMRGVEEGIFTQLVKNTYKVLLTRGLLGTYLYSVDKETQEYFESLLKK